MDTHKLKFTILELEVISLLNSRAGEKFSQREVAKALNVSPAVVSSSVKRLVKEDLIVMEKTKTINFVSFNRENHKAIKIKRVENLKWIYI